MQKLTRALYTALLARLATLNEVDSAEKQFSVVPSVQQTLETKLQLSSGFLARINIVPVTEMSGEKLKLGTTQTIAGRTDTTVAEREPVDPTDLESDSYECKQTNYDTALRYSKLDMWAKFPNFQTKFRDVVLRQQALDRIMVGWNGTSAAATTDRDANPLLQDVNIGWLQHIRTDAPAHWMKEVVAASGAVTVGEGWDYENIDALVMDVTENLIDEAARDNTNLVVICGRALLADKYFSKVNRKQDASEELASDIIVSKKQIGGLEAVRVPFFPANALLVTTLDNLSIYYQEGKRRQQLKDKPERDRIENYESSNDAYVVEDYGITALVENIVIKTTAAP
jgi:P2 family phage major capsid protein